MANTEKTAMGFMQKSNSVSPSTKTTKPSSPVFGPSSQFAGIGVGVKGDPRK